MQKKTFIDDDTVPVETRICYSKSETIFMMKFYGFFIISAFCIVIIGIIYYLWTSRLVSAGKFGLISLIISVPYHYFFVILFRDEYNKYLKAIRKEPQILMNEQGLQTTKIKFQSWENITQAEVKPDQFIIRFQGETKTLFLMDYDIDVNKITHLLKIYRGRFEQQRDKENLQRS
jgi:hypothetical protein